MPNPLVQHPLNTSDEPRQGEKPIVEQYAGVNLPYRGTQDHGVPAELVEYAGRTTVERGADLVYEDPEPEPVPVPVRIVSSGGRELKIALFMREYAQTNGRLILGRDDKRTNVEILNLGIDTIYIGASIEQATSMQGWPLASGEKLSTSTQNPLYARSSTVNDNQVAIHVETAVPL